MKEKHPIDDFFKKGLAGHTTKPSPAVWEKIAAETGASSESKGGWYMMRAAVVVLLIGLSTWVYYQNNPQGHLTGPDLEETVSEGTRENSPEKKSPPTEDKKQGKETPAQIKKEKEKSEVPIMQMKNARNSIYVANDALPEVVEEETLVVENEQPLATGQLDPAKVKSEEAPQFRVKVRLTKPVTASAFYTSREGQTGDGPEKKPELGFKEKVYAYASDQFGNLVKGRPLELPKTEKRPQLEINLDKLLNN